MFTNISSIQRVVTGSLVSSESPLEYIFGYDTDKGKLLWLKRAGQAFNKGDDEWVEAASYLMNQFGRGNVVHATPSTPSSAPIPFAPSHTGTIEAVPSVPEGTFMSLDGLDVSVDVNRTHLSAEALDEVAELEPDWEPAPTPAFQKTIAGGEVMGMGAPPGTPTMANVAPHLNPAADDDSDDMPDMSAILANLDAVPESPEYQERDFLDPNFQGTPGLDD